jgi:drug/metabolite transporter (DMT)-like permease
VTSTRPSVRNAPTWVTLLLGLLGVVLIVVAIVYLAEPAHKLPSFFPGHTAHGTRARTKHGIAAAVVAVLVLAAAWLTSGRKRAN